MPSRRTAAIAAGALVASAGLAASGPAAATGARRCPPPGARLIARGEIMRVYSSGPAGPGRAIEACLAGRTGHMTLLAGPTGGALEGRSLTVGASSGPLVAYLLTSFGAGSGSIRLLVADVAARRVLRELPVGHYADGGLAGYERPTEVVLGPEGGVGWIAAVGEAGGQGPTYTVHTAATVGEPRLLDEGADIGAGSLSLTGFTLHWWHGGIEHSAPLPGS